MSSTHSFICNCFVFWRIGGEFVHLICMFVSPYIPLLVRFSVFIFILYENCNCKIIIIKKMVLSRDQVGSYSYNEAIISNPEFLFKLCRVCLCN